LILLHLPPVEELECIWCRGELALKDDHYCCVICNTKYPIVDGVPMLIPPEALERAAKEDDRWLRHPVEGADKPARRALFHKKGYVRLFEETVLLKFGFCGRVLEIGAGSCWASALVKRFNPKCKVYSTDISVRALLKGVQVSQLLGASMDYVVACDAHRLPFKDGLFDAVLGVAILHHLVWLKEAIGEIWRVLKPGGMYVGVREGLAGSAIKPLYRLLGRGWEEERRFGAIEQVYTYEEWIEFLSNFKVEMTLKRDAMLGLAFIERAYYTVANFLPESILRRVAATLEIVARKPIK